MTQGQENEVAVLSKIGLPSVDRMPSDPISLERFYETALVRAPCQVGLGHSPQWKKRWSHFCSPWICDSFNFGPLPVVVGFTPESPSRQTLNIAYPGGGEDHKKRTSGEEGRAPESELVRIKCHPWCCLWNKEDFLLIMKRTTLALDWTVMIRNYQHVWVELMVKRPVATHGFIAFTDLCKGIYRMLPSFNCRILRLSVRVMLFIRKRFFCCIFQSWYISNMLTVGHSLDLQPHRWAAVVQKTSCGSPRRCVVEGKL